MVKWEKTPQGPLFLKGYIEERIARGDRRTYGYPPSPLPELPSGTSTEVESCIITALRQQQKPTSRR